MKTRGFTLIELLVVLTVLGILGTVVAPAVLEHVGTAKSTAARSQIELLGAALDAYRLDNGVYPSTGQGLEALRREPLSEPRPRNWRGPYVRKDVPTDPWGAEYEYRYPALAAPFGYDLLTYGRDGIDEGSGEDADVRAWE